MSVGSNETANQSKEGCNMAKQSMEFDQQFPISSSSSALCVENGFLFVSSKASKRAIGQQKIAVVEAISKIIPLFFIPNNCCQKKKYRAAKVCDLLVNRGFPISCSL